MSSSSIGSSSSNPNDNSALLLQQRLTEVKHPDHTLITYPNLGDEFYPSSQWFTENGPIPEYVLQDIFNWLGDTTRPKGHLMEWKYYLFVIAEDRRI